MNVTISSSGVPGPKMAEKPEDFSRATSASGIVPPAMISTSSRPASPARTPELRYHAPTLGFRNALICATSARSPDARAARASASRRPTNSAGGRAYSSSVSAETRRLIVWGVVLGAVGVCLLLGYVWVRLMVVEAGYRLSVTRQLVVVLEREGRELAVRAAAADSAARVEELARARLGMRPPERGEEEFLR